MSSCKMSIGRMSLKPIDPTLRTFVLLQRGCFVAENIRLSSLTHLHIALSAKGYSGNDGEVRGLTHFIATRLVTMLCSESYL